MSDKTVKLYKNLPSPPEALEGPALKKWWELARELSQAGLLDEPEDEERLKELAPLLIEIEELGAYIDSRGSTYETKSGMPRVRKEAKRLDKAMTRTSKLLSLLGMTPLGRVKREERKRKRKPPKPQDE